jgi:hypothetical protein
MSAAFAVSILFLLGLLFNGVTLFTIKHGLPRQAKALVLSLTNLFFIHLVVSMVYFVHGHTIHGDLGDGQKVDGLYVVVEYLHGGWLDWTTVIYAFWAAYMPQLLLTIYHLIRWSIEIWTKENE